MMMAEKLTSKANESQAQKASFERNMNLLRMASFTIMPWILQWWYAKSPIFCYPADFVPVIVQRGLSFASSPNGCVSIGTFNMVSASVIHLVGNGLLNLSPLQQKQQTKTKVAMAAKS